MDFTQTAREYQNWLDEDEIKEILDKLPEDIYERIREFSQECVSAVETIEGQVDDALADLGSLVSCIDDAVRGLSDLEGYADAIESTLEDLR